MGEPDSVRLRTLCCEPTVWLCFLGFISDQECVWGGAEGSGYRGLWSPGAAARALNRRATSPGPGCILFVFLRQAAHVPQAAL